MEKLERPGFDARYSGECATCGRTFLEGERIIASGQTGGNGFGQNMSAKWGGRVRTTYSHVTCFLGVGK